MKFAESCFEVILHNFDMLISDLHLEFLHHVTLFYKLQIKFYVVTMGNIASLSNKKIKKQIG